MRLVRLIFILTLMLLMSCNETEDNPDSEPILRLDETLIVDGMTRSYHIQHPQDPDNKPLVIVLHGHGGSSDQSLGMGLGKNPQKIWLDVAKEHQFLVVVPNGEPGIEGNRGWNDCRLDAPANPTTDDVTFIKSLLDDIASNYNHDVNKVYVAGVSNGAMMAQRLVEEIPEKIAAFASIVNNRPGNSACVISDEPVSALYMNGTVDLLVPYEGGQIASDRGLVISTDQSIAHWVQRNQTDLSPTIELFEDINTNDNSTVEKYTYDNGLNNTQVILYKVIGGGHTEPSLVENYSQAYLNIVGEQNEDIEMAEEIWKFFEDKSK